MTDPYVPDRPVICPYDNNHVIAGSRLQKHLIKCSKNYPPDYMVTCPYNATHRFFKNELEKHTLTCPDVQHVDPSIYELHHQHGLFISSKDMDDRSSIDHNESWDGRDDSANAISVASMCQSTHLMAPVRNNNDVTRGVDLPSFPIRMREPLRPPRGLPEAMLREESEDSLIDETGSVGSFMWIGRGKPWMETRNENLIKIGRGRGSGQSKS